MTDATTEVSGEPLRSGRSARAEPHDLDGYPLRFGLLDRLRRRLALPVPEEDRVIGRLEQLRVADHLRAAAVRLPVRQELLAAVSALLRVPLAEQLRPLGAAGDDHDVLLVGKEPIECQTEQGVVGEAEAA